MSETYLKSSEQVKKLVVGILENKSDLYKKDIGKSISNLNIDIKTIGTGFFISDDAKIMTCAHVIKPYMIDLLEQEQYKLDQLEKQVDDKDIKIYVIINRSNDENINFVLQTAKVVYWSLYEEDMAILQLINDANEIYTLDFVPPLIKAPDINISRKTLSREAYICGFPNGISTPVINPNVVIGDINEILHPRDLKRDSKLSIEGNPDSYISMMQLVETDIPGGYSGSPVILPDAKGIIGMVFSNKQELKETILIQSTTHFTQSRILLQERKKGFGFAFQHLEKSIQKFITNKIREFRDRSYEKELKRLIDENRKYKNRDNCKLDLRNQLEILNEIPLQLPGIEEGNYDFLYGVREEIIQEIDELFDEKDPLKHLGDNFGCFRIKEDPLSQRVVFLTANYWYWRSQNKKAEKYYEILMDVQPLFLSASGELAFISSNYHFNYGTVLIILEKYKVGIIELEKSIDPDFIQPTIYYNWGIALGKLDKHEEAIEKYRIATELDPEDATAYHGWGHALSNLGRYEEAIKKYRIATELDPEYVKVYFNWGHALSNLGRYEEAIEKYRIATELDPEYVDAYYNWGIALGEMDKHEEEIEKYRIATELDPEYVDAYFNWGHVLSNLGRYEEAIEKYRITTELDPEYVNAYFSWGIALFNLGRKVEAIDKVKKSIDILDPEDNDKKELMQLILDKME